ncbi:hypothetical protein FUA48_13285 [Flavobacterium alkalisoli]|uniref:Uncharacterized protein n=2 Tax=Flavobacterium TaxID=237 RepID=A0A444WHE2_9FLAO|nr:MULTISPECIES: hypothetical protein [Flavobacterium]QEE50511.1 hypothetical protein FUA48_13285 [Flavobacterium alkalisoli]RYJ45134.1 hypothetical protein NU09_0768 [Flavobacterium beibuense]
MIKAQLQEAFGKLSPYVKNRVMPVIDILLERAEDLDSINKEDDADYYEDELESIMKEVRKIKYIEDQWQIMNAKKNN